MKKHIFTITSEELRKLCDQSDNMVLIHTYNNIPTVAEPFESQLSIIPESNTVLNINKGMIIIGKEVKE